MVSVWDSITQALLLHPQSNEEWHPALETQRHQRQNSDSNKSIRSIRPTCQGHLWTLIYLFICAMTEAQGWNNSSLCTLSSQERFMSVPACSLFPWSVFLGNLVVKTRKKMWLSTYLFICGVTEWSTRLKQLFSKHSVLGARLHRNVLVLLACPSHYSVSVVLDNFATETHERMWFNNGYIE